MLPSSGDSFPDLIQKRSSQHGFVTCLLTYLRSNDIKGAPKKFLVLNSHNRKSLGKRRKKWKGLVQRDALQIPGIRNWRRGTEEGEEWR